MRKIEKIKNLEFRKFLGKWQENIKYELYQYEKEQIQRRNHEIWRKYVEKYKESKILKFVYLKVIGKNYKKIITRSRMNKKQSKLSNVTTK